MLSDSLVYTLHKYIQNKLISKIRQYLIQENSKNLVHDDPVVIEIILKKVLRKLLYMRMHWATCSPAEFIHFLYQLLSSLIRNEISKTFSQCFQTYMNKFKPKYSLK